MYEGFPSRTDESRMQAFHAADWAERAEIADAIEDDRRRELGRRLIFENAPATLDKARRSQLEAWLENRREGKDGVETGRTLAAARDELDRLIAEKGESRELSAIVNWLATLA